MKTFLLIVLFITIPLAAQTVTVLENAAVTNESEGRFYYPTVSPDGKGILFSTDTQKGLW